MSLQSRYAKWGSWGLFYLSLISGLSCHLHPKPNQTISVRGAYYGKMFGYFIPQDWPKERWSLAGDAGFMQAYLALFEAKKDSLQHLHPDLRPEYLFTTEMWVEAEVQGVLSEAGEYCKHVSCKYQLDLTGFTELKPLNRKPPIP